MIKRRIYLKKMTFDITHKCIYMHEHNTWAYVTRPWLEMNELWRFAAAEFRIADPKSKKESSDMGKERDKRKKDNQLRKTFDFQTGKHIELINSNKSSHLQNHKKRDLH